MEQQSLDKRSLIGFLLIGVIVAAWMMYQSISTRPVENAELSKQQQKTSANEQVSATNESPSKKIDDFGRYFTSLLADGERFFVVETDNYIAKISSKGGNIASWKLKRYKSWYDAPLELIRPGARELSLAFSSSDGKKIDASKLTFSILPQGDKAKYGKVRVYGDDTFTLLATLQVAPGSEIVRTMTFKGNSYALESAVAFNNMEEYVSRSYDLNWNRGLRYQEENSVDESNTAAALASMNGSINELDATDYAEPAKINFTGSVDYLATRNKYFLAAIQPINNNPDATVFMEGMRYGAPDEGMYEEYQLTYRQPLRPGKSNSSFRVFLGPQQYDLLKEYHLESTINFGWRWLIAPIGEYFMLPIFTFIHKFIPNYGIAIIVFSVLMKLLLYPLSIQQLRSTQKMQVVAPEINKIREKYPDDQVKQQQETMAMYSQYGINPAGGCLPLVLQMPILYSLWAVLSNHIELRQAHFFGWITNLSVPDVIFDLGFQLPLFNIDKFSGLALIMGATLFVQQKISVTDPRQKSMVYIMPIMFTLLFSSFPAGLNLYYLVFNLLGIGQQLYVAKYSKTKLTLEDLRKMPKKESWLQKRMKMAQELAQQQGGRLPAQSGTSKKPKSGKK